MFNKYGENRRTEKTEEETIQEILDGAVYKPERIHRFDIVLSYGKKELFITIKPSKEKIETFIENISREDSSMESETTLLYKAAKIVMQNYVDVAKRPFEYEFVTEFPVMKKWVMAAGREIFNWDEVVEEKNDIYQNPSHNPFLRCHVIINPTQAESPEKKN